MGQVAKSAAPSPSPSPPTGPDAPTGYVYTAQGSQTSQQLWEASWGPFANEGDPVLQKHADKFESVGYSLAMLEGAGQVAKSASSRRLSAIDVDDKARSKFQAAVKRSMAKQARRLSVSHVDAKARSKFQARIHGQASSPWPSRRRLGDSR